MGIHPSVRPGLLRVAAVLCLLPGSAAVVRAQFEVDENALFGDTSSITESVELVDNPLITADAGAEKSVGLSGKITSAAYGAGSRGWLKGDAGSAASFSTYVVGNLFLDIRRPQGAKAFANLETQYIPASNQVLIGLKELFIDWNIRNRVYFRSGKQVLQWGRCYFWNPTDLINVEKKLFIQEIGYREGAYGMKVHVPFGTALNIYSFIDTRDAGSPDSLAAAGKVEFMAGNTEMAFSAWGKSGSSPVYGYDISSRLWGLDISGEIALFSAANYRRMEVVADTFLAVTRGDGVWRPRACLGLTKYFTVGEIKDRLSVVSEFYYNGDGADDNAFSDAGQYAYLDPVAATGPAGIPVMQTTGTRAEFLSGHNLYEMNNYSKYYLAVFTGFSRFILTDMTLSLNGITNLNQQSAVVSAGVTYTTLNDFALGLSVNAFLGAENTEYTFRGRALSVQGSAGLSF